MYNPKLIIYKSSSCLGKEVTTIWTSFMSTNVIVMFKGTWPVIPNVAMFDLDKWWWNLDIFWEGFLEWPQNLFLPYSNMLFETNGKIKIKKYNLISLI